MDEEGDLARACANLATHLVELSRENVKLRLELATARASERAGWDNSRRLEQVFADESVFLPKVRDMVAATDAAGTDQQRAQMLVEVVAMIDEHREETGWVLRHRRRREWERIIGR